MAGVYDDIILQYLQEIFSEKDGLKRFLETLLNEAMKGELTEHLKAEKYERSGDRAGHRNGYKSRRLSSRVGRLELNVPQARNGQVYHPSMLEYYQRSERALMIACAEMYFQGVSTRKVNAVLQAMCSTEISSSTVSRIAQQLDGVLSEFANRRLDDGEFPFMMIDARYEKVRIEGKVVSQAVLVAVGIDTLGRREILEWRVCDSESQQSWGDLFESLKLRGLRGLELVISDAHTGITAALQKYFQGVQWQRCRVHFKRELMSKVPAKLSGELMKELSQVYAPEERIACLAACRSMADRWRTKYPAVAKMLEEGFEDTLSVCPYPEELRKKFASTNMLESLMKRLKQRTKVVQIFPCVPSCWRLVGAQLLELQEHWLTGQPYVPSMKYYYME